MKQKKSKQRKEEEDAKLVTDALNPIDKMRVDLLKLGYDLKVVNAAMDEMWNLELDYTDFNSILNFLQAEDLTCAATSGAATSGDKDDIAVSTSVHGANDYADPIKSPPFVDLSVPIVKAKNQQEGISNAAGATTATTTTTTNISLGKDSSAGSTHHQQQYHQQQQKAVLAANKASKKIILPKKINLSEKLDFVANSENLNDGIIALAEWVTKAASPTDIQELCSSTTTNALKTVIRRSISNSNSTSTSIQPTHNNSTTTTGQLLDLVGSILRTIHSPSGLLMAIVKALGSLLRKASDAIAISAINDNNYTNNAIQESIAQKVADRAVHQLSNIVDSVIHTSNSPKKVAEKLKGEIEAMEIELATSSKTTTGTASANTASINIVELMNQRDRTKAIVYKYTNLIRLSLNSSPSSNNTATATYAGFHMQNQNSNDHELMKEMLGNDYDSIVSSKKKLQELQSREQQTTSSITDRDQLVSMIHSLTTDKKRVQNRMEQLRKELHQLVEEEIALDDTLGLEQSKLDALEGSLSREMGMGQFNGTGGGSGQQSDIHFLSNNVKVEECVSAVAKDICEFVNAMDAVSSARNGAAMDDSDNQNGSALAVTGTEAVTGPNTLGSLLTATSRYFASELKAVEYLKKRAAKIQAEVPTLQREIVEFAALGMATTVLDMKKKEKEMQDNIMDDNAIVEGLVGEADVAKNAFVDQLQGFLFSPAFDQTKQESYATALKKIDGILSDLGINGDAKWSSVIIMYRCKAVDSTLGGIPLDFASSSSPRKVERNDAISDAKPKEKKHGWKLTENIRSGSPSLAFVDIQNEQCEHPSLAFVDDASNH